MMDLCGRLETTTAALLALRDAERLPEASRARWLRMVSRILVQFDLDAEADRWPAPRAAHVAVMTATLAELDGLRDRDDEAFQAVFMRALTHPVTRRPLMAWNDTARALCMSPADVRAAHRRGLHLLGAGNAPGTLDAKAA